MGIPRRQMLVGIALMFAAQFLPYATPDGRGSLYVDSQFNTLGHYWFTNGPGGTGWEVHEYARYLLPAFAVIYLSRICETVFWKKWGYLLTLIFSTGCWGQATADTKGFWVGILGFAAMCSGAYQNRKGRKASEANAKRAV